MCNVITLVWMPPAASCSFVHFHFPLIYHLYISIKEDVIYPWVHCLLAYMNMAWRYVHIKCNLSLLKYFFFLPMLYLFFVGKLFFWILKFGSIRNVLRLQKCSGLKKYYSCNLFCAQSLGISSVCFVKGRSFHHVAFWGVVETRRKAAVHHH